MQHYRKTSHSTQEYGAPILGQAFLGRHFWARGYFAASSGNITDEAVMQYIENQDVTEGDDGFKISE